jgi:hypothetical protein
MAMAAAGVSGSYQWHNMQQRFLILLKYISINVNTISLLTYIINVYIISILIYIVFIVNYEFLRLFLIPSD